MMAALVKLTVLVVVVVVLLAQEAIAGGGDWDYAHMTQWPTLHKEDCGGNKQSPVNVCREATRFAFFWPLKFKNYNEIPLATIVNNNQKTLLLVSNYTKTPEICGGNLPGKFLLHSQHFHWGSDDTQGSEHTFDSVRYPLEYHMVHYNSRYENLTEALEHKDGLAVLGVLFKISTDDNPALAPLIDQFDVITNSSIAAIIDNFYAPIALVPENTRDHFRYDGSLTTPKCQQVVTWTLFKQTLEISRHQLEQLRTLQDDSGAAIENNYRDPQPLHGRTVYRSFWSYYN